MIRSGYSVGISDLVIHPDLKKRFQEEILKGKKQVIDVTKKIHLNILEDVNRYYLSLKETALICPSCAKKNN